MILTGTLLLSGFALIAVESVGYTRGGYDSAFWRLSLDEKLDHVHVHLREWWWISIWALIGLFTVSSGSFGFAHLLAEGGEPVLAYVGLGGFVVAVLAWVVGLTLQAAAVSEAAKQRAESGATPAWLHPLWSAGYLAEMLWIVGSNIAYSLAGLAILRTGVIAKWAGWIALIGGPLIAIGVLLRREGFPQLGVVIPAVLGVALLIEAM